MTGAGVIFGSSSIGDDGVNKTIGDVSRTTIGERKQERDGSDSGTGAGADNVLTAMIGTRAAGA